MRKPSLALAAVAALLVAGPSLSQSRHRGVARDPEVWVTIGQAELAALEDFLGREGLASIVTVLEGNDVARLARTRESRLGDLAAALHARFHRCGGFTAHRTRAEALATLDAAERPATPLAVTYTIDNGPTVQAILGQTSELETRATITQLSSYLNRYYTSTTGVQAAQWLKSRWETIAQGRSDVKVQFFNHAQWAQPSVMAIIYGTDFPKEAVVIGGHLDSISMQQTSLPHAQRTAPGADDDASGVASLTETFRAAVAAGYRPARTVMFMAYAAEEVGLRGSAEIAQAFLASKFQVIGALQLDMTNYKGSAGDIYLMTDNTNAAQNTFLQTLTSTYLPTLVHSTGSCGYGCSDHASWHTRGFAASIPFEALMTPTYNEYNPNIHKASDTLSVSGGNANHAVKFSKLGAAYVAELAKGTIVPPRTDESGRRR